MLFLFLEAGGRPVAIYLLVNVLNIYADDADDVDNVDDVDDVGDVGDVGDADLAKTLLPTILGARMDGMYVEKAVSERALLIVSTAPPSLISPFNTLGLL
jgi:hypothetical protein